jgi:hypothetical protein
MSLVSAPNNDDHANVALQPGAHVRSAARLVGLPFVTTQAPYPPDIPRTRMLGALHSILLEKGHVTLLVHDQHSLVVVFDAF